MAWRGGNIISGSENETVKKKEIYDDGEAFVRLWRAWQYHQWRGLTDQLMEDGAW